MPGSNAFPHKERLTRRREYLRVFRQGAKRMDRAFVCYVAPGDGPGRKMGCVVSRKVGGAVVRNRIKRYIREVYRTHRSILEPEAHVVIVARNVSAGYDYRQCEASIQRLFQKGESRGE